MNSDITIPKFSFLSHSGSLVRDLVGGVGGDYRCPEIIRNKKIACTSVRMWYNDRLHTD